MLTLNPRGKAMQNRRWQGALVGTVVLMLASAGGAGTVLAQSAPPPDSSVVKSAQDSVKQRPQRARRGGANLITQQEIEGAGGAMETAEEIVQRLRPAMLRARATSRSSPQGEQTAGPLVYLDNQRLGGVDQLSNIPSRNVKEIRLISPIDATQRWGTDHWGGVLQVISKGS